MKRTFLIGVLIMTLFCTFTAKANEPPLGTQWKIEDGVLTIYGQGAMKDYADVSDIPWYEQKNEITKIVVQDGITRIGNLAFYGLTNATEATIAESVKEIGISAFDYTEGTKTSIGNPNADFIFSLQSDKAVVSKGDEFTVSINLTGDFKDVSMIQSVLLFDTRRVAIDEKNIFDKDWKKTIDDSNLGYISSPLGGIVTNNVRIAYFSTSGNSIDSESPLYTKGKTTITIAKIKCKALMNIAGVDDSCFYIQNSAVLKADSSVPTFSETQLTRITSMPMKQIVINGNLDADSIYNAINSNDVGSVSVFVNGNLVNYDTPVYKDENGNTMLPLRHTVEALGGIVNWEAETRTVFSIMGKKFVATQIGHNMVFLDDGRIEIEPAPVIRDSRTFFPLSYFDKIFGTTTTCDETTIKITKN